MGDPNTAQRVKGTMRSTGICVAAVLCALVAGCGGSAGDGSQPQPPSAATVAIRGFKFQPATLEGHFDTGGLAQGRTKAVVLPKAGTYVYRCDFHPFMTGEIVVK